MAFSEGLAKIEAGEVLYIDEGVKIVNGHLTGSLRPDYSQLKSGFIDKTGRMVIDPKFDDARSFSNGLAAVKIDNKWGYIDKTGVVVIKAEFDNPGSFSNGLARVKVDDKWCYIDKTGKYVWEPSK